MQMVKILRLVTGEDIICHMEQLRDEIIVKAPMEIFLKIDPRTGNEILNLNDWLPQSILAKNETVLFEKDILCVMEPSDGVIEYFTNSILKKDNHLVNSETEVNQEELKAELMKRFLQGMDVKEFGSIQ
jgi:hypothetical protein